MLSHYSINERKVSRIFDKVILKIGKIFIELVGFSFRKIKNIIDVCCYIEMILRNLNWIANTFWIQIISAIKRDENFVWQNCLMWNIREALISNIFAKKRFLFLCLIVVIVLVWMSVSITNG